MVVLVGVVRAVAGLDDIQGETAAILHAGSAQDGAKGAGGATLLADHLANIGGRYLQAEHDDILIQHGVDVNGGYVIDQCPGDLAHERLHLGERIR